MKKQSSVILLFIALLASLASSTNSPILALSYQIELEGFRWQKFPVEVFVDTDKWSSMNYAAATHEALDSWIESIGAYTNSSGDEALRKISYTFYIKGLNSSSSYDILITFAPGEIVPGAVGFTNYSYNILTHEIVPPLTINVTTYSGTASYSFVKNTVMHEFGHALGLGHAFAQKTSNGPELMYYASAGNQTVYPSTLDLYGLEMLYQEKFSQIIQLPSSATYEMVWPLEYGKITIMSRLDNTAISGEGTYRLGTVVTLEAPDIVNLSNKTRFSFSGWELVDTHQVLPNRVISVTVNSSMTVIVDWVTEYFVEIETPISTSNIASGYIPKGTFVSLHVSEEMVDLGNGTRMVFRFFNANNFYVSNPVVCTAYWERQYLVNVTSDYGNLSFYRWATEGEIVNVKAPPFVMPTDWTRFFGVRYRLNGWISNDEFLPSASLSLEVRRPFYVAAMWEVDYLYTAILVIVVLVLVLALVFKKVMKTSKSLQELSLNIADDFLSSSSILF